MKQLWMTGAAAMMAVSIAGVNAQSTTPQTQTPTSQQATGTQMAGQTTTLRGCVYKEQDIPGRAPNVAERAGVMEDYILVPSMDHSQHSGAMSGSTGAATSGTATGSTTGSTTGQATAGTSGTMTAHTNHKAFKLEKIADERLRAMVGKMVEVTGKIDAEASDTARTSGAATTGSATGTTGSATGTTGSTTAGTPARDRSMGPDGIELPEFEVTAIKEVQGTCPATPEIKK